MRVTPDRPRAAARVALGVACLLAFADDALALNPSLEINQYAHTSWTIRDGFFKGQIRGITQTSDGYLWLATEFGLLRFDGIRPVPWEPSGDQHLPSSDIWSILAGRDGSFWIGTAKGLARWKGGTLTQYPELSGRIVGHLVEDRRGTVWASGYGTPAGILCAVNGHDVDCAGKDGTFGYGPFALHEDRNGNLWVGMVDGLWRWRPQPGKFFPIPGAEDSIGGLEEDEERTLLFTTHEGIRRVAGDTTEPYLMTTSPPHSLRRDRDGSLWIGTTTEGLVRVRQGRTDRFSQADGLSGPFVVSLFEDHERNMWVATTNGLDRFREVAVASVSVKQGVVGVSFSVAASSDSGVWISSRDGLASWTKGGLVAYRGHREQSIGHNPRDIVVSGLPGAALGSVFQDDRGRTWLAFGAGAFGYLRGDRFVSVPDVPARLVRTMAEDAQGNVWVADQELGLFRISATGVVDRTPWSALGHADFASAIAPDRKRGGLWLGFVNGGVAYLEDGKVSGSYGPANGLADGWVRSFHAGEDRAVWVAAEGGLSRLHEGHVTTLSRTNGLPCDSVNWAIADEAGSLWVNLACGLVRFTRDDVLAWSSGRARSITPTVFDAADGVRSESVPQGYSPYVAKAADGRLWFTGSDGANVIDPRHLPFNTVPPPVHIEQMIADRRTFDADALATGQTRLPALTRDLQLDYTALSLVVPEKNRFRVKLEGWDAEWQDVGNRRQAFYSNLPPRSYRFRVIASNNSGVWNNTGATLDFVVAPAYYQTYWFLALSAAAVIATGWGAHRIRLRVVERHEREISALNERLMKAQEHERVRIAGELHDGVMQKLLAVTMMLGSAKRRIPAELDAKAALDKIQDKLVDVGADIRQLSHDLHPPMLQEAGLPNAVRAYCDEFSDAHGMQVPCDADENACELSRGAALALYRILQEALGNAAKHARAKNITVRLARSNGEVALVVSDDGSGFDMGRPKASGGLGLITMRERASQLNGTFEVDSAPGRGTTIRVVIPFR